MRKSLKTHIKFFKSTFIHRKPKLTFGKKHGSYRSHHSCHKDESIVFARWRQCDPYSVRCSLGPLESAANCILIGSAVLYILPVAAAPG